MNVRPCMSIVIDSGNGLFWAVGANCTTETKKHTFAIQLNGEGLGLSRLSIDWIYALRERLQVGPSVSIGLGRSWGETGISVGARGENPIPFSLAWNHKLT